MMIDRSALNQALTEYKRDFVSEIWPKEKYKWQAVQQFQDNWDVGAEDFADMLKQSLSKTGNLLASAQNFPARMIQRFADRDSERVRAMFVHLFDESLDVFERIEAFKSESDILRVSEGVGSHYQTENSISTYLWLRYPDKYYIYKLGICQKVSGQLQAGFQFKQGKFARNIRDHQIMYDALCGELQTDPELRELLDSQLTPDCYPDPLLKTMTIDVGFFISRNFANETKPAPWWPSENEYHPGLTVDDWERLLADPAVFDQGSLEVMARLKDIGGHASCAALASRYGRTSGFYNGTSSALARRVAETTDCPVLADDSNDNARWWPILYTGRSALKDEEGSYIWRLRDELSEALDHVDLSDVSLYAEGDTGSGLDQETEPYPDPDTDAGEDASEGGQPRQPSALAPKYTKYTKRDFLTDVYMPEANYERLINALRRKKNLVLQGAPGVGKTFAAKRLAWSMMGEKDTSRVQMIQFHQNYSYEDFMMGYKPSGDGFELREGVFYSFCKAASGRPDEEHFFIIDEINRGNMSKVFGELLMLIENDYRGTELTLAYNGEAFAVPENVHIIGMMNTADRSLAMIDYALRRRFSFVAMRPGFDSEGFLAYQSALDNETFDQLVMTAKSLNAEIAKDPSLGPGFCIGHSYFCEQQEVTDDWLQGVVDFDILPMLEEYWFDDPEKVERWRTQFRGVLQS